MSEPVMLTDRDWHTEPRGKRDILRCLIGRHRGVTQAIDDGVLVSRCSCGAISFGGPWMGGHPIGLRRAMFRRALDKTMKRIERDIRARYAE